MDPFALIESTWWLGIPIAFLAGIFLGLSPLALPITGTAAGLGISGAVGGRSSGVKLVAAFGAGMILVYTAVGLAAGRIDAVIEGFLLPYAGIGYLLIAALLLGLSGWLLFRPAAFCTACAKPLKANPTVLGAFLAGIPGGFVNCPACAAIVTGGCSIGRAAGKTVLQRGCDVLAGSRPHRRTRIRHLAGYPPMDTLGAVATTGSKIGGSPAGLGCRIFPIPEFTEWFSSRATTSVASTTIRRWSCAGELPPAARRPS